MAHRVFLRLRSAEFKQAAVTTGLDGSPAAFAQNLAAGQSYLDVSGDSGRFRPKQAVGSAAVGVSPRGSFRDATSDTLAARAVACIVLRQGQDLSLSDIVAFLDTQEIAKFKYPERVEIFEEFPLSNFGKVSKKDLVALVTNRMMAASQ